MSFETILKEVKVSILVLNGWLVNLTLTDEGMFIKGFNPCFKWMVG